MAIWSRTRLSVKPAFVALRGKEHPSFNAN
jgi:hypothetical protein